MLRRRCRLLPVSLLTALLAAPALASHTGPSPLPLPEMGRNQPGIARNWRDRILGAFEDFEAGKYAAARRKADFVIDNMIRQVERGGAASQLLGCAVFVRALAEVCLGHGRDADWDYGEALAIAPSLALLDPESYAEPGSGTCKAVTWVDSSGGDEEWSIGDPLAEVSAPKKIHAPRPMYPRGKQAACIEQPIEFQVVIDREGKTQLPRIVSGDDPSLIYTALESVRDWTFEPALLDGKPVTVYYDLIVNFSLPYCHSESPRYAAAGKRH